MSVDFDAITIALAARFDPANVTPPSGVDNISKSYPYGPTGATKTPFVVVNPPEAGRMTFGGQERAGVHTFTVELYLPSAADTPRTLKLVAQWLSVAIDQTLTGTQLGGRVALSWTGRYETGTYEYGGSELIGIHLFVDVTTTDGISPTA